MKIRLEKQARSHNQISDFRRSHRLQGRELTGKGAKVDVGRQC